VQLKTERMMGVRQQQRIEELRAEIEALKKERDDLLDKAWQASTAGFDELRARVDDLTNAATTAKNLLSRKHPHSVADVDGDAWEAWAVLEAALSQT